MALWDFLNPINIITGLQAGITSVEHAVTGFVQPQIQAVVQGLSGITGAKTSSGAVTGPIVGTAAYGNAASTMDWIYWIIVFIIIIIIIFVLYKYAKRHRRK